MKIIQVGSSGWAAGFGRLGGMIAPALVGVMLANQLGINNVFMMFAAVLVAVAAIVLGLGIESRQKSLEEISATTELATEK